ncbi:MAG: LysM peptidoglycan-binding domain-containing protein [Flavobacteriales bacterium]|nr:LysM peptidoglycan-binding domain-containing protein [Flavobacteriales bacterium]
MREVPVLASSVATERTADGREAIDYRVRSGDYLGRIAMRFGVKVSQIKTWNKLRNDRISAGDRLVIYVPASQRDRYERHTVKTTDGEPTNSTAPRPAGTTAGRSTSVADHTWYTVQAGDSLYAIAQRFPGWKQRT